MYINDNEIMTQTSRCTFIANPIPVTGGHKKQKQHAHASLNWELRVSIVSVLEALSLAQWIWNVYNLFHLYKLIADLDMSATSAGSFLIKCRLRKTLHMLPLQGMKQHQILTKAWFCANLEQQKQRSLKSKSASLIAGHLLSSIFVFFGLWGGWPFLPNFLFILQVQICESFKTYSWYLVK